MHFLDFLFGMAAGKPRFFADGWGDRSFCTGVDFDALVRRRARASQLRLGPPARAYGGLLRDASFASPEARLPDCARTARVKVLLPEDRPLEGLYVHLAASGDQGFALRLRFAAPLLAKGIGAVVLENAYYGARRPSGQLGPAVRSVSDLYLMASATFQEGRALLRWAKDELRAPRVGVTGFSMGGQLAAMVGASMPFPLAVVPVAATFSPDSLFKGSVLRGVAHLAALRDEGEREEDTLERLTEMLSRFSVARLPAPILPEAAIVVGTAADGIVPPAEMRKIAAYWGCELRWLPAGHVTAVLRHQGAMRDALLDALVRVGAEHTRAVRRRLRTTGPARRPTALAARAG